MMLSILKWPLAEEFPHSWNLHIKQTLIMYLLCSRTVVECFTCILGSIASFFYKLDLVIDPILQKGKTEALYSLKLHNSEIHNPGRQPCQAFICCMLLWSVVLIQELQKFRRQHSLNLREYSFWGTDWGQGQNMEQYKQWQQQQQKPCRHPAS